MISMSGLKRLKPTEELAENAELADFLGKLKRPKIQIN